MRKPFKITTLLILTLLITSCWDQRDLEKMLIVYGVGIDKTLDETTDSEYLITIGFPTIIEDAPEKKMEYSTPAKTLADAYDRLQRKAYREISYDNTRLVVFGEEAARDGINQHIDAMFREPLFPGTARFAVVEGRAIDLMKISPPVSLFVSTFLFEIIKQSNIATTSTPYTTLRNFHNQLHTKGIEPIAPYITYSSLPDVIYVGCTALFKDDKLIEVFHGRDSLGLLMLRGEINSGYYTASFTDDTKDDAKKDAYVTIRFLGGKSKVESKIVEDELNIYHKITIEGHLAEFTDSDTVFDTKKLEEFEKAIAASLKKDLSGTLKILQKILVNDNIGYGRYVRVQNPDFFDSETWNETFEHIPIHLEVEVKITAVGITR